MRRARNESGTRLFRIGELLMPHQIPEFFSRLAVQSRHQVDDGEIQEEDVNATVEESNSDDVRKTVDQNINLQHPIVFDQYDACQLVHNKDLKKLTINLMERLCLELGLATPNHSVHRRAPYEQALEEAVALCSCNV